MEENKSLNQEENEGKKAAVVGRIRALSPAERAALLDAGTEIRFLPFLPGFSTTSLIAKIAAAARAGTL